MDEEYNFDEKLASRVTAKLKLEPLTGVDPNDQAALLERVRHAHQVAYVYYLDTENIEVLKMLAMAQNQWGVDFHKNEWAQTILSDEYQDSEDRVTELYLYMAFLNVGPQAIDFSTYSILKWKREFPDFDYENRDIHVASQMALDIARETGVDDLLSTYTCVEIILHSCVNFMENPICQPIKDIFLDDTLSGPEKAKNGRQWLVDNIEQVNRAVEQSPES